MLEYLSLFTEVTYAYVNAPSVGAAERTYQNAILTEVWYTASLSVREMRERLHQRELATCRLCQRMLRHLTR